MKLNEYQKLSKRTMPDLPFPSTLHRQLSLSNYAMGLAGESGEVVDLLKKHVHHRHTLKVVDIKAELGDVLHYVSGISSMLGITLEDVATANIEKLRKRYPNGFSEEASINRSE